MLRIAAVVFVITAAAGPVLAQESGVIPTPLPRDGDLARAYGYSDVASARDGISRAQQEATYVHEADMRNQVVAAIRAKAAREHRALTDKESRRVADLKGESRIAEQSAQALRRAPAF